MKHNQDWSEVDLEAMPEDFIPATAYFPDRAAKPDYDTVYGTWETADEAVPVASQFRVAWRTMAASTGYRTIYPALIVPGAHHVDLVMSAGHPNNPAALVEAGCYLSSILIDFQARSTVGKHLRGAFINGLPVAERPLPESAQRLFLRLNCLTAAYAPLWEEITGEQWTPSVPLRIALDRELAQIEIDALVALSLGVTAEELCMIYRTQFPVMRRYDSERYFDATGRLVPRPVLNEWKSLNLEINFAAKSAAWVMPNSPLACTFQGPLQQLDRETKILEYYALHSPSAC